MDLRLFPGPVELPVDDARTLGTRRSDDRILIGQVLPPG